MLQQQNQQPQYSPAVEVAALASTLRNNEKVTLIGMGDMGFAYTRQVTIKAVELTTYAQYEHAVKVTFRPKGKRTDYAQVFYANHSYASMPVVVAGHVDFDNTMHFSTPEVTASGVSVSRAKYASCDSRNVTDLVARVPSSEVLFRPARF